MKYRLKFDTPNFKKGEVFDTSQGSAVFLSSLVAQPISDEEWFERVLSTRWKPGNGDMYWFISLEGPVDDERWCNYMIDKGRYSSGNVFETKYQAEEAAKRVKATLLAYQEELMDE